MKKSQIITYSLLFLLLVIFSGDLFAQRNFDSHKQGGFWRHWYFKGNVSINAMFGDVSTYDYDPFKRIQEESAFSWNVTAGKWVIDWGGAEINFSKGNLYSFRNNLESNTTFNQYTISGIINFTELFYRNYYQTPFYIYGKIGYGLIDFNAVLTDRITGDTIRMQGDNTSHGKRVTEWVVPMGIGGAYNFNDNFAIIFDVNYFYVDTDKLDGKYISSSVNFNDDRDSYASFSIGVMYTFNIRNTLGKYRRPYSRSRLKF